MKICIRNKIASSEECVFLVIQRIQWSYSDGVTVIKWNFSKRTTL